MPFPNEHAARQADPGRFESIRRGKFPGAPAGIDALFGVRADGKSEVQSFRFDRTKWTVEQARRWLKDNGHRSTVEAATMKVVVSPGTTGFTITRE